MEREDGGGFRRDCFVSTLIPKSLCQVGHQADSGAWDTGRCHPASRCLAHASGSFSVGSSKPGIRPVVNRFQNVQPEHGLIQLHGYKPLLALAHPQLSLQSTLVSWKTPTVAGLALFIYFIYNKDILVNPTSAAAQEG